MNQIYSILMREVNYKTGEIAVNICEKGTRKFLSDRIMYLKLRSLYNIDLDFYISLQENEKEAIKQLKKNIVKKSDLYQKI